MSAAEKQSRTCVAVRSGVGGACGAGGGADAACTAGRGWAAAASPHLRLGVAVETAVVAFPVVRALAALALVLHRQQAQPADRRRRALGGQAERSAALPSVGDELEVVGCVGRG